ncbi:GHMP kinase [Sulfobacillus harzensis]|uniref:GHMP kinase n=1 Tax=Sulfobacillus harzensis TaxID=2729629 RepID=A0A7Y0L3D7_9FIRM|nr:GHMP kinase [Sulfobacillus harzensis]NMP22551.1 GHMP kinase [Sulfobacillus harzensis]
MDGQQPGWGFAPGTFGELVQGQIADTHFLITLPIAWGTRATFTASDDDRLDIWPPSRRKAGQAVEQALADWKKPPGGVLVIQSALPVGKGMASSSADIVASLRAAAAYYGIRIQAPDIARRAAALDPTDGIMYPSMVAFNPLTGKLLERLGTAPPALIIGALGPGRINTEDHHRVRKPYEPAHQRRLQEALDLVRRGVSEHRVELLGQAGRLSAEVDLERQPDEGLARFLDLAAEEGVGVVIGHSGTVRGMVVPQAAPSRLVRRLEQRLWSLNLGFVYRINVGLVPHARWSGQGHKHQRSERLGVRSIT